MSDAARARFQLVESIFQAALAVDPADRAGLIAGRTRDEQVRAEVLALIAEDQRAAASADADAPDALESALDGLVTRASVELGAAPTRIAGYRIIREVGRGGMGVVHEAEQDEPRRRVALKLVAAGIASSTMASRFRREARALGRLDHPGIARIHEAGTFDAGAGPVPFFAMEFIDGRSITDALSGAPLAERLTVLAEVADAVHHAHQRGVVHRDLKPANVLVDEQGRPRIVDFGVARLLDPDDDLPALRTVSGQLVGTPAYMSPEQASGDAASVDARTDIHALGSLAFELLSGHRPLDLEGRSLDEQLRRVREQSPRRLGAAEGVPRDVALVVARALEKDPDRRHASAAALADDLRAARDGRPVSARPASIRYLVGRMIARHPVRAALATGAAATLAAGGIVIAVLLARSVDAEADARRQLARAEREADIARGVRTFLVEDVLTAVSPDRSDSERVTVDDLVAGAATAAVERFATRPIVGREVLRTLAEIDLSLGRTARAAEHLEAAAALPSDPADPVDPDDPNAVEREEAFASVRAGVLSLTGDADDRAAAREIYREILAARTARLGPEDPATLAATWELARTECLSGDVATGLDRFRRLLAVRERRDGPDARATLGLRTQIGNVLLDAGRFEEALSMLELAAATSDRRLGRSDWNTINTWINLGETRRVLGDFEGALADFALAREGFEQRGTAADTTRFTALDMNVGLTLMEMGELDRAEPLLRGVHERAVANGEEDAPGHQSILHNLGALEMLRERYDEAEAALAQVLASRVRVLGEGHIDTLLTRGLLGEVLRRDGRPADAVAMLEPAWRGLVELVGVEHEFSRGTAGRLSRCHAELDDMDAALCWAERARPPASDPADEADEAAAAEGR